MSEETPGQETGQAAFSWREYVDGIVSERGSLTLAALHLAERRGFEEDVGSVERGLRRLRERGSKDGGVWGERALRCFGLPAAVSDRVRWMGQYHTRFSDLPASLCEELLRPWDRPPVSESPARIWVLLGRAGLALRRRRDSDVEALLEQAALLGTQAEVAAQIELCLVTAFAWTRTNPEQADAQLERARVLLEQNRSVLHEDDYACLFARWIDHVAYPLNKFHNRHREALALYEQIPAEGPLFARCRRENGLGWSHLLLEDRARAQAHARASVEAAGDSGSLRMRAMALNLLAAASEGGEAERARERARAIARRLEDEALLVRFGTA
jgi:tetratricopeptide (TPR) repeat protein